MEILFLWAGVLFTWVRLFVTRWVLSDEGGHRVEGEIIGYVLRVDKEYGSRTLAPVIGFTHPTAGGG